QRVGDILRAPHTPPDRYGIPEQLSRSTDIAAEGRKFSSGRERTGACGPRFRRRGQRLRQSGAPFAEMRMQPPEPSQRASQSQRSRSVRDMQASDGRPEVVVLALQFLQHLLVISPTLRMSALGYCLEIGGMVLREGIEVSARAQLLEREV